MAIKLILQGRKGPGSFISFPSRFVTHLQIQLLATIVVAVVRKRGGRIRQNVDELLVVFASIERILRNVFNPFNRRGIEMPPYWPGLERKSMRAPFFATSKVEYSHFPAVLLAVT